MTKKSKVIRTIAAVTAAALLGGGIYLLVKNDVAQKINWQDILIYAPTPIARETLDEAVNNSSDKPSADRVSEDTKKSLPHRSGSFPQSTAIPWLGCIFPIRISITRSCSREIMNITLTGRWTAHICTQDHCLWITAVQAIFLTLIA